MKRLLSVAAVFLVAACAEPVDRDAVFRAYVDAVNRSDVSGALRLHTPDAVFLIPGQDTIRGLGQMRGLLQWDSVLQSSIAFGPSELRGDTLVLDQGSERSLWFSGIGMDSLHYAPGLRVVFDNGLIDGIFPSALTPASATEFETKVGRFLAWGTQNATRELATLMTDGRFRYDADAARQWLVILDTYADAIEP